MKPFVIIVLSSLAIKSFNFKEEWLYAIGKLRKDDKRIIALKWSPEASEYIEQRIEE